MPEASLAALFRSCRQWLTTLALIAPICAWAQFAPQRPGVTDVYFIGLAGDSAQRIFEREAKLAKSVVENMFDAKGRSAILANRDSDLLPGATAQTLRATLLKVAQVMDKDEDLLIVHLTSHGSKDGLHLSHQGRRLPSLSPQQAASAVADAGLQNVVIIISACHAGVFIEPLRTEQRAIFTAADAEHKSYGCDDKLTLTQFTERMYLGGLRHHASFIRAFSEAEKQTAEYERTWPEHQRSYPQQAVGQTMRVKLQLLAKRYGIKQ